MDRQTPGAEDRHKDLTKRRVERLQTPGRYRDAVVKGLYLQVSKNGAKSWILRYVLRGREHMMGLGSAEDFGPKEARERAKAARQQLADKVDPLQVKRERHAAAQLASARQLSFREAAEQYMIQNRAAWSIGHAKEFASTLRRYVYPALGNLEVAAIDTPDVLRAIEPIWQRRTVTAKRTLNRVEMVLSWTVARGHRPAGLNPAKWEGHFDQILPSPKKIAAPQRFAALPYARLPEFMEKLRGCEGIAARALEFTILTAARSGETFGARWSEIDSGVWTIPASRMKGGKEHRVPLSPAAVKLLRNLPREDDVVFIGRQVGRGLDKNSMTRVLAHLGHDVTVHGFRSCFSDWAHETTAYSAHVIELSLAHSIGNASEKAYRRGDLLDKRRQLMEAWSKFCSTPLPEEAADNVTPIRGVVS